jgi:hypothetical protein
MRRILASAFFWRRIYPAAWHSCHNTGAEQVAEVELVAEVVDIQPEVVALPLAAVAALPHLAQPGRRRRAGEGLPGAIQET